jgi:hypothetical protein
MRPICNVYMIYASYHSGAARARRTAAAPPGGPSRCYLLAADYAPPNGML